VIQYEMLPLADYRARIALDDGFVADAATCEQLPGLIDQSVACLEGEPYPSSVPPRPTSTAAARDVAGARRRLCWLSAQPGAMAKVIFNVFGDDDREAYEAVL
jgi:hypothetical protein